MERPVAFEMGSMMEYTQDAARPVIVMNMHIDTVDKAFLRFDQLRGSSGSLEGAGTRTTSSRVPPACLTVKVCCKSTRWTVPGMTECAAIFTKVRISFTAPPGQEKVTAVCDLIEV